MTQPLEEKTNVKALVILSGGQDSITCLGLALKQHHEVEAISFRYGQKHSVELECAATAAAKYNVPHKVIDISFFGDMVTSALTSESDVCKPHAYKPGLPASFVPNRNALFITISHAYAQEIGATVLYAGVCETDYSGYPDCRHNFISQLAYALNVGYETSIFIETPLMFLNKAETFKLASDIGFLEQVLEDSHTCYNGDRTNRFEWGYGCGKCPSCELRAKGFEEFKDLESASEES
jgi:7-cyano-7-deazaguanine synthase